MSNSEKLAAARERLAKGDYMNWDIAGGPNECEHGYASGIPCRQCDAALIRAAVGDGLFAIPLGQIEDVGRELLRSKMHGEVFASLHEAYAVILEELDEIWDVARQKRRDRDPDELRKEFVQLGAMAFKALASLDNFIGGKV